MFWETEIITESTVLRETEIIAESTVLWETEIITVNLLCAGKLKWFQLTVRNGWEIEIIVWYLI